MGTQSQSHSAAVVTERPNRRPQGTNSGGQPAAAPAVAGSAAESSRAPAPAMTSAAGALPEPLVRIPRLSKGDSATPVNGPRASENDSPAIAGPNGSTAADSRAGATRQFEATGNPLEVGHHDLPPQPSGPSPLASQAHPAALGTDHLDTDHLDTDHMAAARSASVDQPASFAVVNDRGLDGINVGVRAVDSVASEQPVPSPTDSAARVALPHEAVMAPPIESPPSTLQDERIAGASSASTADSSPTTPGPTSTQSSTAIQDASTTAGATAETGTTTATTSVPVSEMLSSAVQDSEPVVGANSHAAESSRKSIVDSIPGLGQKLTKRQRVVAEILFQVGLTVVLVGVLLLAHALLTGKLGGSPGQAERQPEQPTSPRLAEPTRPRGRVTGIQIDEAPESRVIQAHFESVDEGNETYPPHLYGGPEHSASVNPSRLIQSEATSSVYYEPAARRSAQGSPLSPMRR